MCPTVRAEEKKSFMAWHLEGGADGLKQGRRVEVDGRKRGQFLEAADAGHVLEGPAGGLLEGLGERGGHLWRWKVLDEDCGPMFC